MGAAIGVSFSRVDDVSRRGEHPLARGRPSAYARWTRLGYHGAVTVGTVTTARAAPLSATAWASPSGPGGSPASVRAATRFKASRFFSTRTTRGRRPPIAAIGPETVGAAA